MKSEMARIGEILAGLNLGKKMMRPPFRRARSFMTPHRPKGQIAVAAGTLVLG